MLLVLPVVTACSATKAADNPVDAGWERRTFSVSKFSAISAGNRVRVVYTPGASRPKVTAEVREDWADDLSVTVEDGILRINLEKRRKARNNRGQAVATLYVEGPDVESVDTYSGADFAATRKLETGSLRIQASSGSRLTLKGFDGTNLRAGLSSGSRAELGTVRCSSFRAETSSGASLSADRAENLQELDLEATSAARIELGGDVSATNVDLSAGSGGRVGLPRRLEAGRLRLDLSSGGRLELGSLAGHEVTGSVSSGARVSSGRTEADKINVRCSSGGRATWRSED